MTASDDILRILDQGAEAFVLPMLDNGYVHLAATRISLHRSDVDWALVFEVFGFSPRAGLPDLCVCTFGRRLRDRDPSEKYVSREAYSNYLTQHPNDDSRFFHPIAAGAWQDPESDEIVSAGAREVLLTFFRPAIFSDTSPRRHPIPIGAFGSRRRWPRESRRSAGGLVAGSLSPRKGAVVNSG
jgi:hypothetical protein